ncbi:endonuclease/exonuclease/phosphatase family metal-dependent hydrolase [Pontibacter aydingkolensis]|uniref:Endonuclease/exonuclease/phosphatase family protein n=1 Tax=Pontibacter aydingkolensis TaxID=1911536 RepID=A0ABS7CQA8_9BACT|nr:endonuclease/exonuclease/phosphatase family protein [Pontibacter aydingkolensis]MBW7466009.1 endonuclease/exonuclease/phosphatase family protein [Pontibacter aydingkolensis]
MPFYSKIKDKRTAEGLLRLKQGLAEAKIPKRTVSESVLLATWNIREFGKSKMGLRTDEPLYYIAEIINSFDLVAVQEVRSDLRLLNKLMGILGGWWKVVHTDVTLGTRGHDERLTFLYDSRKLSFGGLAGEIVIPPVEENRKTLYPSNQLYRTPFLVGFKAGWFRFTICVTHIVYGKSTRNDPNRVEEIRALADLLAGLAKDKDAWAKNMILLGDFNIFKPGDKTMEQLLNAGFVIPKKLQTLPSNVYEDVEKGKHYDQIAFISPQMEDKLELCKAGVFNYYNYVYRMEDEGGYGDTMGQKYKDREAAERSKYYKNWRTFQMSDHLPMWIELGIDDSESYLKNKINWL